MAEAEPTMPSLPFSIGDRIVFDGSGQFSGNIRKGDVAKVIEQDHGTVRVIWEGEGKSMNDGRFLSRRFSLLWHKETDATDTKDAAAYYEAITAQPA